MKKNKGFTLIEVVGVIIIVGLLALVAFPPIINQIKRGKDELNNSALKLIYAANIAYIDENLNEYPKYEGSVHCISLQTLVDDNKIQEETINSLDDEDVDLTKVVKTTFQANNKYINELVDSNKCTPFYNGPKFADTSGANAPVLDIGMIPIVIENDGTVKKANNKDRYVQNWYDYNNKKWANAVLVNSANRDNYQKAEAGTTILENHILAYFVWIPRYEYYISATYGEGGTSLTNPGEIKINFINNTSKASTPNYIVHPAFTFGSEELKGIWVGKFETTGTATTPTIKPNLASLRSQNISTQFRTALKLGNRTLNSDSSITDVSDKTQYGLTRESRMMKNTEWGAVVYLTQSKYGRCTNGSCTEVSINNSSSYKTGSSAGKPGDSTTSTSTAYLYNTEQGYLATTTGNIYGIYDMSGGSAEYVMGVMNDVSGKPYSGYNSSNNSGFNGNYTQGGSLTSGINMPYSKYFNAYDYSTSSLDYTRALTGDATKEISGWYNDTNSFVNSTSPWFVRGGYYSQGASAGIFYFNTSYGAINSVYSFRIVVY